MAPNIRGVEKKHEVRFAERARDTRTSFQRVIDTLANPQMAAVVVGILGAFAFVLPVTFELMLLIAGIYGRVVLRQHKAISLPMRVPTHAKALDSSDLSPSTGKPVMGKGIHYLGNDRVTNEELWLTDSDLRKHNLVLGTTGGGKTENLKGYVANALSFGSGVLYVDGKADTTLWASLTKIAHRFGRDDDLLVVNFLKSEDPFAIDVSNTLNPLSSGSADTIRELVTSLMSESGGDNAMWKDRAISLIACLVSALVHKRDHNSLLLDVDVLRSHLELPRVMALEKDETLPDYIRRRITAYLASLPGYKHGTPHEKLSESVLNQHGFLQMQFTNLLASLADTYGAIFSNQYPDIDLRDVMINRRVVVVLLPALLVSSDALANLGKIIVANVKAMMGSALGSEIEGDVKDIIDTKPTNAETPFYTIYDESSYYIVDGMAVKAAQARSLGFSLTFGAQDVPQMEKRNKTEAQTIIANTGLKVGMAVEDPGDTAQLLIKSAGQALVDQTHGFERDAGSFGYKDGKSTQSQRIDRIDVLDLKAQQPGEAHFVWSDRMIRGKTFYVDLPDVKTLKVSRGLYLPLPRNIRIAEKMERMRADNDTRKATARQLVSPRILGQLDDQMIFAGVSKTISIARANTAATADALCAGLLYITKDHASMLLGGASEGASGNSSNATLNILDRFDEAVPDKAPDQTPGFMDQGSDEDFGMGADDGASTSASDIRQKARTTNIDTTPRSEKKTSGGTDASIDSALDFALSGTEKPDTSSIKDDDDLVAEQSDFKQALAMARKSPVVALSDDDLFADMSGGPDSSMTADEIEMSMLGESPNAAPTLNLFAANAEQVDWDAPDDDQDAAAHDLRYSVAEGALEAEDGDGDSDGEGAVFGADVVPEGDYSAEDAGESLISKNYLSPGQPEFEGLIALSTIADNVSRSTAEKMLSGMRNALNMTFRHPTKREQVELLKKNRPTAESLADVASKLTMSMFTDSKKDNG